MSDDFKSPDEGLTEWDSSKATLMRVDFDLRKCAEYAMQKNYSAWYDILKILKREAFVKLAECKKTCTTDKHEAECKRGECETLFDDLTQTMELYLRHTRGNLIARLQVERKLDKAETFLRDFMDKKGMLLRNSKDAMTRFRGM